ncbi:ankyrin repeat domain-containing protein [Haloplasma contractile]|uniref:Euchromatic histone-lysine N-methyltransferase protein n=1 Tax=Haloplasma contractile SSD-17B TaxID=1033810 RepID=U2E936_9MOLU|nr:ankyrin repeat domain-containing protein [Haloplasma contractile]ERJ11386.1 euchromatic histone-lysine N-methyltransferase protein [Haloplasma contractile SSD-17B]
MKTKNEKLFEACITGNVSDLKQAIEACDDLNIKNEEGQTPLCIVAKCRYDLVKLLVLKGADVNLQSDEKISPLHWAVEYDNEEIVEYLLSKDADIYSRDHLYETPLHWAAWTGHHKPASLLLAQGANPLAENSGGFTPLDLAKRQGHQKVVTLFEEKLYHTRDVK